MLDITKLNSWEEIDKLISDFDSAGGGAVSTPIIQHSIAGNYRKSIINDIISILESSRESFEKKANDDTISFTLRKCYNTYIDNYNIAIELIKKLRDIDSSNDKSLILLKYRIYVILSTMVSTI